MTTYATHLAAKVAACNLINSEVIKHAPALREAVKPFVGQQIMKAGGGFMQKFAKELPKIELPGNPPWHLVFTSGHGYTLRADFKVCVSYGAHFACYAERALYLGDLSNGVLSELYDEERQGVKLLRTDYTVDEVQQLRKDYETARALADKALSKLQDFGQHDN